MPVKQMLLTLICLLFLGQPAASAADTTVSSGADSASGELEMPSDDMLEFLGQWETDKGIWVDPGDLDWLMQPGDGQNDDE